jgi:hypothetical protein
MRIASLFLFALLATPAAAADCPQNMLSAGCYPDAIGLQGNAPAATLGQDGFEAWTAGQPCLTGCYDLPAGVLVAKGSVNPYGGCVAAAQVHDDFEIVGPPGPPLSFEALLQVHAVLVAHT